MHSATEFRERIVGITELSTSHPKASPRDRHRAQDVCRFQFSEITDL
jgi:hypothetical protein